MSVPRARRGFTLIELLIVVVIIGILAAIAIPKFASVKGRAYFAGMQSDLHNLTTAQESYFYDHASYTASLDSLHYSTSHGDTVVVQASVSGWSATATNSEAYPHLCALFMGSAAPLAPATTAGVVACE
jgi:prepilin-type N-terminal cleavage/methylation domain-containing protein